MTAYDWISIEVGYSAASTNAPPPAQNGKDFFVSAFFETARRRWDLGGSTELAVNLPPSGLDDSWVALLLAAELEAARGATIQRILIREEDRCFVAPADLLAPKPKAATDPESNWTGRPGVQCQLRGNIWIDRLSYRLMTQDANGNYVGWEQSSMPASHFAIATLSWRCQH